MIKLTVTRVEVHKHKHCSHVCYCASPVTGNCQTCARNRARLAGVAK